MVDLVSKLKHFISYFSNSVEMMINILLSVSLWVILGSFMYLTAFNLPSLYERVVQHAAPNTVYGELFCEIDDTFDNSWSGLVDLGELVDSFCFEQQADKRKYEL